MIYVDDQQLWNLGTERLKGLLAELSAGTPLELTKLLALYRKAKEAFAEVVAEVDAVSDCSECCGQCCQNGKYRMNVFDTMARIAADIPTAANFYQKPLCPYGTYAGCSMEPGLRPADCVLFICDAIDQKLLPQGRLILSAQECIMRECIHEASVLTGMQTGTPLLLWAGK
jgi:hypothetical protein